MCGVGGWVGELGGVGWGGGWGHHQRRVHLQSKRRPPCAATNYLVPTYLLPTYYRRTTYLLTTFMGKASVCRHASSAAITRRAVLLAVAMTCGQS